MKDTVSGWVRRTKIVATLGPASNDQATVRRLVAAGVDVFRVNFSHASHENFALSLDLVRTAARQADRHVAVLADLQGPKLRIGDLVDGRPITLADGDEFEITTLARIGDARCVSTPYTALARDVRAGDRILLDDGNLELRVISTTGTAVKTVVVHGGLLGEHKGINLPGVNVSSPALTEKDRVDLAYAVKLGADFIALSFVRHPHDVDDAKNAVREAGGDTPVFAKIEKPEAIERLDEILDRSDGAMVARGDLGVEMAPERVPTMQKHIITKAGEHLIPVITATQMLESMIHSPRPTRAEASDVANAIIDGSDGIMLSGETASGEYPVEAVETMVRIAREAETAFPPRERRRRRVREDSHAIANAACHIAEHMDVRAIAAFTRSGFSARIVSKDKPPVPVYAYVPDEIVARRLATDWGVFATVTDFDRTTEEMMEAVEADLLARDVIQHGEAAIVVGGTPLGVRGRTNFLKIMRAGEGKDNGAPA
jgi:pyruvate kinase